MTAFSDDSYGLGALRRVYTPYLNLDASRIYRGYYANQIY